MANLITLEELFTFLTKDGKTKDYDGQYGGECIDVIKYLLDLVYWGKRIGKIGNADELWVDKYNILSKDFRRIVGSADLQYGDIIFLNTAISFKHVGIFLEDLGKTVRVFDQVGNGEKVGGETPPGYRVWDKSIVMGVWRPKRADAITEIVNEFANRHGIRKRGSGEFFDCRELLSILARLEASLKNK